MIEAVLTMLPVPKHVPCRRATAKKNPRHVDRNNIIPVCERQLHCWMMDRNPGIIYENIQTSPLLIDGGEACFDCCFILITSTIYASTCTPAARRATLVFSTARSSRSISATAAPASTRSSAVARPIPLPSPLTIATWPSSRKRLSGVFTLSATESSTILQAPQVQIFSVHKCPMKCCGARQTSSAAHPKGSFVTVPAVQTTFSEIPGVSSRGTSQQGC